MSDSSPVTSDATQQDFEDTPEGWYSRWKMELDAAKKWLKPWHDRSSKIVKRFVDNRKGDTGRDDTRWNVFTSNIQTQRDMLYGRIPQVSVDRRFADSKDVAGRQGGEILERLLNQDICRDSDAYAMALKHCCLDFLLTDFANARVRFEYEEEKDEEAGEGEEDAAEPVEKPAIQRLNPSTGQLEEAAPAVPKTPEVSYEDVAIDYLHWEDQLWSAGARIHSEVRWWGHKSLMGMEDGVKRFGEAFRAVPMGKKQDELKDDGEKTPDPWQRASVWEIWDKETKRVFWLVDGYAKCLDIQDDPYQLEGFWPCPRFMGFLNASTSEFVPVPDFTLVQDLYNEIDEVSTRITRIEKAIKVAGVYDQAMGVNLSRLVNEAGLNELIGVPGWGALMEKGGLAGAMQFLPLDMIVAALDKLRDYRTELINAVDQLSGMSDIVRGEAQDVAATATEQAIKGRFASVRMQSKQDEFARFASDLQRLRAELICKRYQPQTILERSNAASMFATPEEAMQGVQLLQSKFRNYRVQVKPESVSLTDFAALKSERLELLGALTTFIQAAAPIAQQLPGSLPFLLQLLQWCVSGLKGASTAETILDHAIQAAQAMAAQQAAQPQQQQPDPKALQAQAKAQGDIAKIHEQTKADLVKTQAETNALAQRRMTDAQITLQEDAARQRIKSSAPQLPFGPGGGVP